VLLHDHFIDMAWEHSEGLMLPDDEVKPITQQAVKTSDSVATTAVRGGGAVVVTRIFSQVVQNASTMVLARILVPEDFGVVAMAAAILAVVIILNDLGFIDASIQSDSLSEGQASNLFWISVLFNLILFAILSVASLLVGRLYGDRRVTLILVVISSELVFLALGNQHFGMMKREMQFGRASLIDLSASVAGNVLSVLSALLGAGYWALVLREVARPALRAVGAWCGYGWRPGRMRDVRTSMRLVWFGIKTSATLLMRNLGESLTSVLIGKTFGASELAYYDRSQSLMMLSVSQMSESIYHVAISTLRRAKNDAETFRTYYLKAISTLCFVSLPIGSILAVLSPECIRVFLGPGWDSAAPLLRIFSMTIGFRVLYSSRDWIQVAFGRATQRLLWDIGASVITVAAVFVALRFGLRSMTWVVAMAPVVLVFPGLSYAGKPAGLTVPHIIRACWRLILAAAGAGSFLWFILLRLAPEWSSILRLLFGVPMGILLYLVIVAILHGGMRPIREFIGVVGRMRRVSSVD
jgi:PST family polysaccharide transporter